MAWRGLLACAASRPIATIELSDRAAHNLPSASPVILLPMLFLYSWEEVAAFVRQLPPPNSSRHTWQFLHADADIFRTHMLAYLTEHELMLLRNSVRQSMDFSDPSLEPPVGSARTRRRCLG
jgi:hypothetical protein